MINKEILQRAFDAGKESNDFNQWLNTYLKEKYKSIFNFEMNMLDSEALNEYLQINYPNVNYLDSYTFTNDEIQLSIYGICKNLKNDDILLSINPLNIDVYIKDGWTLVTINI